MIRGELNENREALVTIEINDAEGRARPVEVVLDTGFTGYLTLPAETIRQLGLLPVGRRTFELANGELFEFEAYLAGVSWHGRLTDALVLRSDSEPLLGMTLLWGSRLTLDAMAQGEVRIEPLEAVASKDTPPMPPIMKRLLDCKRDFVKNLSFAIAFGSVATVVILAFAYGIVSLPLNFGEILTYMGVWLAIGVLLGQNKPPAMPLMQYLPRRIIVYFCCYVFFIAIAIAYVVQRDGGASDGLTGKEIFGLFVISFASFAAGFFAGQDKEQYRK